MTLQCFYVDGPCPEKDFFARASETERVLKLLGQKQNVSIVGLPKIGKSSLLMHISRPEVLQASNLSESNYRFIYVDCCDLEDLDPSLCCVEIVRQAHREIPEVSSSLPSEKDTPMMISECYRRFFRRAEKSGLRCIVMLDHFESLIENPRLDHTFLESLRAMNQMHQVVYVVASTELLGKLEEKWIGERDEPSPFFNIFHQQILRPFSQDESTAFLRQRFGNLPLSIPNSTIDLILNLSQGQPYLLQSCGVFVISLLDTGQRVWGACFAMQLQDYLAGL